MSAFIIYVGRNSFPEAFNEAKKLGDVGSVDMDLVVLRARGNIGVNDIMSHIKNAVPAGTDILIAEVSDSAFNGQGGLAHAAGILRCGK